MTLELVRSLDVTAVIGISGHAGCGHAHSHCGFVQALPPFSRSCSAPQDWT